ncbi:DsbE family thiol:disulfide interchange protein [Sedimenticola selenatireducens]|uniref:DsbE family thiol:disulfide interchange protein n=1 Tax=Sedimenticola selenatireducens TaxID=191960 RepID=UPI0004BA4376|nr:DsbE family thiol:disulfide interchange protein [Sedimenticola selenatireducens]
MANDLAVEKPRCLRWGTLVPFLVFVLISIFLAIGLTMDPRLVPSPLIGKAVPEFNLPPVKGRSAGLSAESLKGEVSLVNVFASWCTACRQEHPILMALSRKGSVSIHGLNYKDKPDDAAAWLDELGDPYTRTGADIDGMVGLDWGVYGVPETFVVDSQGVIQYKHIGPINEKIYLDTLQPIIENLRKQETAATGD